MKMLITVDGKPYHVEVQILDDPDPGNVSGSTPDIASNPTPDAPASAGDTSVSTSGATSGGGDVESPIAGNVLEVLVKAGDTVNVNDTLIVLEAMKMESNVASPYAGVVKSVNVKPGEAVSAHHVLVSF